MQDSVVMTSVPHIVAATVSIVFFLIYRNVTLRMSRQAAHTIWTVTRVFLIITACLLGRTYLSVFGPIMAALAVMAWMVLYLVSDLYFVERPSVAQQARES